MKNFDYAAAERGATVCTRDGHKARVLCFDSHATFYAGTIHTPIIAEILIEDKCLTIFYTCIGCIDPKGQNKYDLMMADDDYLEKLERGEYDKPERKNNGACVTEVECTVLKTESPYDDDYWRRMYAGMAMQALFKNPLASPSVLGISSGAAFGANLCIAFGVGAVFGSYSVSTMAFLCCFLTLVLVYVIATTRFGTPTIMLLLAGTAVGSFFGGMTDFLQFFVDDADVLASMVYWSMGSFAQCDWLDFKTGLVIVGVGVAVIAFFSKDLNLLTLGDDQARALGVNIRRTRLLLLIANALIVGGCVSMSASRSTA